MENHSLFAQFAFVRMCSETFSTVVPEAGEGDQGENENVEFLEVLLFFLTNLTENELSATVIIGSLLLHINHLSLL